MTSPVGTIDPAYQSAVPTGLILLLARHPAMNRRAIVNRPYGTTKPFGDLLSLIPTNVSLSKQEPVLWDAYPV